MREVRRLPVVEDDGEIMGLEEARELALAGRCSELPRPCPLVSCRHNLFLDVDDDTGEIEFAHPGKEPNRIDPHTSCAIDVAMRGSQDAEFVADLMGMGPLAFEELEQGAVPLLREGLAGFEDHRPETYREDAATPLGDLASSTQGGADKGLEEWQDDRSGRVVADRLKVEILSVPGASPIVHPEHGSIGFTKLDPHEEFLEEYCRAVYKVYERDSRFFCEEKERAVSEAEMERRGDATQQHLPDQVLDFLFEEDGEDNAAKE